MSAKRMLWTVNGLLLLATAFAAGQATAWHGCDTLLRANLVRLQKLAALTQPHNGESR